MRRRTAKRDRSTGSATTADAAIARSDENALLARRRSEHLPFETPWQTRPAACRQVVYFVTGSLANW